jgi:hypothetical protein
MVMPARLRCLMVTGAVVFSAASSSYAQELHPYAGGSIGAFSVSADEVDGRSAAAGLVVGLSVWRYADVEVEVLRPTSAFTRSYTGISHSFAPRGSTREEIERLGVVARFDRKREVTSNISAVIIFRPPLTERIRPGVLIGVANQHAKVEGAFTPISIPEGVDPLHPSNAATVERSTRNFGGLTIGANLAISISRHLDVVPDLRYDYGSIGDEINNAFRTSVKVVWRF